MNGVIRTRRRLQERAEAFRNLVLDRIFVVLSADIPGFMLPKGFEEGFMRIRPNTVRRTQDRIAMLRSNLRHVPDHGL
jgi:hypothetical protein